MERSMRVTDLLHRQEELARTSDKLRKLCAAVQTHPDEAKALMAGIDAKDSLEFLANGAANQLKEYAELLGAIAQQVVVPWPPVACETGD